MSREIEENPPVPGAPKFDFRFQNKILALALSEPSFLERFSGYVEAKFFSEIPHQILYEKIAGYYQRFGAMPTLEAILDEIERIQDEDQRLLVAESFEGVLSTEVEDKNYYLERVVEFCRRQSVLLSLKKGLNLLREGDLDRILPTIEQTLQAGAAMDPAEIGLDYWENLGKQEVILQRPKIPTLLGDAAEGLDKVLRGGLEQERLGIVMMPTGKGKSVFLLNIAGNAVFQRYNVIYITLELSETDLMKRFTMFFTGLNEDTIDGMTAEALRATILSSYQLKNLGKLVVKNFPMSSVSVGGIETYLRQTKHRFGWSPDLLVVDYLDIIRRPFKSAETHEQLEEISKQLKGLAQRHRIPVWTASQVNRTGAQKDIITNEDSSASYAKIFAADVVLTASPKDNKETEKRSAKLFVSKNRQGRDGRTLAFDCDFEHMRFQFVGSRANLAPAQSSAFAKFREARRRTQNEPKS